MTPPAPTTGADVGRVLGALRTAGLVVLVVVDVLHSAQSRAVRAAAEQGLPAAAAEHLSTGFVLMLAFGAVMVAGVVMRKRFPVLLALLGSAATVFEFGPTTALIGLVAVLVARPVRTGWLVGVVVAAATFWSTWRDVHAVPTAGSFWQLLLSSPSADFPWFSAPLIAVGLLVGTTAIGLWLRTRNELRIAAEATAADTAEISALSDQVSRQAERERLAREIHDGIGHRLSLLSVHAGAVMAAADAARRADPDDATTARLFESASLIRESASASVDELHTLLDILRNPDDDDIAAAPTTLADLGVLVAESQEAGMVLRATIAVDVAEGMDPRIAQAAYRITQEILTNARKHAPGQPVRLMVAGGPEEGLDVSAVNDLDPTAPGGPGSGGRAGLGVAGMSERAERHGGQLAAGPNGQGQFCVVARLPWHSELSAGGTTR